MSELKYCYHDAYLISYDVVSDKKFKFSVCLDPVWNKNISRNVVVCIKNIEDINSVKQSFDANILLRKNKKVFFYSVEILGKGNETNCNIAFDTSYGDINIKCGSITENELRISKNEIETFYFHDSFFTDIKFLNNELIWSLCGLSVSPDNSQSSFQDPITIGNAVVKFKDYKITYFKTETGTHTDSNGIVLHENETVVYHENDYNKLIRELFPDSIIYQCSVINENSCRFFINAGIFVEIVIEYSDFIIEWDNFIGKAWFAN